MDDTQGVAEEEAGRPPAREFSLLASAVAGRRVSVLCGDRGFVFTDGRTVFLPALPEGDVVSALVIQSALLGCGSLDVRHFGRLAGRPAAAGRFLTLEAARTLICLDELYPRAVKRSVKQHWAGRVPESVEESLRRALSPEKIPEAPESFGRIQPRALCRDPVGTLADGVVNGRQKETKRPVYQSRPDDAEEDEEAQESAFLSFILRKLAVPFSWRAWTPFSSLGAKRKPSPDGPGPGGDVPDSGIGIAGPVSSRAAFVPNALILRADTGSRKPSSWRYPEWNYERRSYQPDWCTIAEYDPAPLDTQDEIVAGGSSTLRRRLAALGLEYRRHAGQRDGEDLDGSALVELAVGRRIGESEDDRIYQARLKTGRDLGVLVLIDASGSTAERQAEGAAIWKAERQLATNLIAALDRVGDRVASFAFYSNGRDQVSFLRVKEFHGRFDQAARHRLASLEPTGYTRIGAAVRHATHILRTKADASNLLLVVISDGLPYDDSYEKTYAEADTRRALHEAVNAGVGCVCLNIAGSIDRAVVERVWGNVTHAQLTDANELTRVVVPLFRSALNAAAPARNSVHDHARLSSRRRAQV